MLENLTGEEGFPSPELIRDLRILLSLDAAELDAVARVFRNLPEEVTNEGLSKVLHEQFRTAGSDPEKVSTSLRVILYVFKAWEQRRLTKEQVASDFASLGLSAEVSKKVQPLLDAMAEKIGGFRRDRLEERALATGTPSIDSALCVVDARAVFRASRYDDSLGDDQPFLQVDHFIPVAILEIVSELNDDKRTQAYLLTEETLGQLIEILSRAKKRLGTVKAKIQQ
jgi:hypothetical protein